MPDISCVYCGASHSSPAEVRRCWERSQAGDDPIGSVAVAPTPAAAPVAPAATVVLGAGSMTPPAALGRAVVVGAGAAAPAGWSGAARVVVDESTLADPAAACAALRTAAHRREGMVVELRVELASHLDVGSWSVEARPPFEVGPRQAFELDELRVLVWANAIDAREPSLPRWWLADAAAALGATPGGAADVVLPDGSEVWLDGGPIRRTPPIDGDRVLHAVSVEHGSLAPPLDDRAAPAELAADQAAAVCHDGGTARIIAPAGSGKTRVLTERARHLARVWQLPVGAVGLVAFNKRAQEEMKERTRDLPALQVRTLNAIALAVVNGAPPFAPRARTWRTIDEPEVRSLLGDLVTFPKRRNTDPVAPWIEALSQVRLGLRAPDSVEAGYDGDVDGLAEVWPRYRASLERAGAVDFDDQVYRAIEILLTDPVARAAAQRACRVMLVDEFQDLTPAHLLLVRLLSGSNGAVFGVGDDDQTIYGYNGADPAWLIDFADLFPGAGEHPLEVNYRCPAGVVEVADRLLRHNIRRVAKTIRAASADPGGWSAVADDDPVDASVRAVRAALDGAPASDVAVLTRVNATLAPVQVALTVAGVPFSGGVGLEFCERTAVRAVLAWLRLAGSDGRRRFAADDLREALRRPSRPLAPRVATWVCEQHDAAGLHRLAGRLGQPREADRVAEFATDLERVGRSVTSGATTADVVALLLDEIGLAGSVASLDASRRGMNRGAQGDDLGAVRALARLHPDVRTFESWLRDHLAARRDPDGVLLATVHRVKGQEWPHVVVHLADEDQFPHRLADDVEEERRLFHVALTRARRHVTIVSGPAPSPFVAELTTEPDPAALAARAARAVASAPPVRQTSRTGPATPDHPLLVPDRVLASEGLVLVDQGAAWVVESVHDDHVVVRQGAVTRRIPVGAPVVTAGRRRGALSPRPSAVDPASVLALDALRQWRDRARGSKPAYTVFDDKTLAALASALPTSSDELSRVKGVGPAKLESYGDDVLAIVAEALDIARPTSATAS